MAYQWGRRTWAQQQAVNVIIRSHILLAAIVGLVLVLGLRLEDVKNGDVHLLFSGALQLDAFKTFSGLFTLIGVLALVSQRLTFAAVLFIIAGSAGTGIFWDRWFAAAGDHFQLTAMFSGPAPAQGDLQLLVTHLPLLLIGLFILASKRQRPGGINDKV